MTRITHIFFDLHGTLVDAHKLHSCYSRALGALMAARYGGADAVLPDLLREWRENDL